MRFERLAAVLLAMAVGAPADGQERAYDAPLETRVWLDRGDEPVLEKGDRVRVYYRTSTDASAAIFHIDTDGRVRLVYPAHPGAEDRVRGGRDYRLLFADRGEWTVREDPGVGHFFMIAAERTLRFSIFMNPARPGEWDLTSIGEAVYEDPYLAIDDYVAALLPEWDVEPYALDFLQYNVDSTHDYPRYLCYDCHDYQPYDAWDPYEYACTTYRVVVYDDPYFYPDYRYVGSRVVFARPLAQRPRYAVTVRAAGEGWSPVVRRRSAPMLPGGGAQYKELQKARAAERAAATRRPPPRPNTARPTSTRPASATTPRPAAVRANGTSSAGSAPPRRTVAGVRPTGSARAGQAASPAPRSRVTAGTTRPSTTGVGRTTRPTFERRGVGLNRSTRPSTTVRPQARTAPRSAVGGSRTSARSSRTTATPRATTSVTPRRTRVAPAPTRAAPRTRPTMPRARPATPSRSRPSVTPSRGSRPSASSSRPRQARPRPAAKPRAGKPKPVPTRRRGGG